MDGYNEFQRILAEIKQKIAINETGRDDSFEKLFKDIFSK